MVLLLTAGLGGCVDEGPISLDFALLRVTDSIQVVPTPGPKIIGCGASIGRLTYVDIPNRTIWVPTENGLANLGPPFVVLETLTFNDTPETCPHQGSLFPLRRTESGFSVILHDREFPLNVSRRADQVHFEGRRVTHGHEERRDVHFTRTRGNTTYTYDGQLHFEFVGIWPLASVRDQSPERPPGIGAYWSQPDQERERPG